MDWYRRRPLFWWMLSFIPGIVTGLSSPGKLPVIGVIICLLGGILWFQYVRRNYVIVIVTLVCVFGLGLLSGSRIRYASHPILAVLADNKTRVVFTGVVIRMDSTRTGKHYCQLQSQILYNYPIETRPVQLWLPPGTSGIQPGDTLRCLAEFSLYPRARNPGEFDYRLHQKKKGLFFQASVNHPWHLHVTGGSHSWVFRIPESLRRKGVKAFRSLLSPKAAQFARAVIFGNRSGLDTDLVNTYASLGVVHVMAVSGLHVGFLILILMAIAGVLRIPYWGQVMFTILGLVLYCSVVEFRPSVVRASVMASLLLGATVVQERYDILNILGAAGLMILLLAPGQLFQLGFQLSFLAVAGIVILYPLLETALAAQGLVLNNLPAFLRWGLALLLVSLAATLGTLPLTAYHFRLLPIWGIWINLLVIPAIGLIVITLFLSLIFSFIWFPLGGVYASLPDLLIGLLNSILGFLHSGFFSAIRLPGFSRIWLIVGYGALLLFICRPNRQVRWVVGCMSVLIVDLLLIFGPDQNTTLSVTVFDVGQGDAILVELPRRTRMLVDAGARTLTRDAGRDILLPALQYIGVSSLDIIAVSHMDNDHAGGVPSLLRTVPVKELWLPSHTGGKPVEYEIRGLADSLHIPVRSVSAGFDTVIAGAYLQTFAPLPDATMESANNNSIVQKLSFGKSTILFTGDIEREMEYGLAAYGTLLEANILKAPHHGSSTSSSAELIGTVDPELAVISVGLRNKFGMPAPEVIKRYKHMNIPTLLTSEEGAFIVETDGSSWQRRYWR